MSTGPGFFDGLRNAAEALALERQLEHLAHNLAKARDVLYLVRGTNYPIALEGALKLKEISYKHAEGCAAGELKHGPIALIDEKMPGNVIALRPHVQKRYLTYARSRCPRWQDHSLERSPRRP